MSASFETKVTVDLKAIEQNYRVIQKRLPAQQQPICIIKSNAYGHGLCEIGQALAKAGADFFGVRDLCEGILLREAGIDADILILLGTIDRSYKEVVEYRLTPVIYHLDWAKRLNEEAKKRNKVCKVHIKIDTGMTRVGVSFNQALSLCREVLELKNLQLEGVMSHLAEATDEQYTQFQHEQFNQVRQEIEKAGIDIPIYHLGNSTAAIKGLFPDCRKVRPGIALYGSYPDPVLEDEVSLQPTLAWKTSLIDIKQVPKGQSVSYGMTFKTERPSRIGLLPLGYADGYPRLLSNRAEVLVRGKRAPIAGRICMDLTMIDLTDIPEAKIGNPVTLIGKDAKETILVEDLAEQAETISYEILARIAPRVPRVYING
jgi:alanine racemase